ncbi:hypothetical protein BGZ61DRAFT_221606 [Ilyonectria robusta]|uniref:uncharacterized protein n=1 Tax=Ilyonectria robusta TaxID=1079257 RepID=UPI001E8E5A11|nr:uncharacterized protein BGZ61DRAFT_221606 [Ilyonectria robusta]KAH8706488.1 hypothetical protein BGZ61DRAFT_221606 [Ilyonectria robusta]
MSPPLSGENEPGRFSSLGPIGSLVMMIGEFERDQLAARRGVTVPVRCAPVCAWRLGHRRHAARGNIADGGMEAGWRRV